MSENFTGTENLLSFAKARVMNSNNSRFEARFRSQR